MQWQANRFQLDLSVPRLMGIVNCTADSFSDGGQFADASAALRHCEQLLREGADILDLGAESSRPGASPLPLAEELARLKPIVEVALGFGVPISIDTYKPAVMQTMLDLGADIINDIWALRQPQAAQTIAQYPQCGVVLMHMHGEPQTMQAAPMSGDVLSAVHDFFAARLAALAAAGLAGRVCLDPGIGFGKTVEQNFELTAKLAAFKSLGLPLLMGWSRKSSLGAITGLPVGERLAPSVAAALVSVQNGANILRVHDVAATRAALQIAQACQALPSTV